jgi:hypothetical protein
MVDELDRPLRFLNTHIYGIGDIGMRWINGLVRSALLSPERGGRATSEKHVNPGRRRLAT